MTFNNQYNPDLSYEVKFMSYTVKSPLTPCPKRIYHNHVQIGVAFLAETAYFRGVLVKNVADENRFAPAFQGFNTTIA